MLNGENSVNLIEEIPRLFFVEGLVYSAIFSKAAANSTTLLLMYKRISSFLLSAK